MVKKKSTTKNVEKGAVTMEEVDAILDATDAGEEPREDDTSEIEQHSPVQVIEEQDTPVTPEVEQLQEALPEAQPEIEQQKPTQPAIIERAEKSLDDVENLLHNVRETLVKTLNPEAVEEEVTDWLNGLKERVHNMEETLHKLEHTKNTIHSELSKRDDEESDTHDKLWTLNEEKSKLDDQIMRHENRIHAIQDERSHLSSLASQLGHTLEEFHNELQAEGIAFKTQNLIL